MRAAILIAYHGGQDYRHLAAVAALKARHPDWPQFALYGCPYVDVARSHLVRMALERRDRERAESHPEPIDRVMFFDHDITWDHFLEVPEHPGAVGVPDVLLSGLSRERPIIGAPYAMRGSGSGRIIGTFHPKHRSVPFFNVGGLYEANPLAGIGMGCTAILLETFDALGAVLPKVSGVPVSGSEALIQPFFALEVSADGYFGEDYSFCRRAHRLGYTSWLDTRGRVLHWGSYAFAIEDAGAEVPQYRELVVTDPGDGAPEVKPYSVPFPEHPA